MSRTRFTALMVALILAATSFIVGGVYLATRVVNSSEKAQPKPASEILDKSVKGFYSQEINWEPCKADQIVSYGEAPKNLSAYECATVKAPLDWDDPEGDTIDLSIAVHRSGKSNAPVLFYNLGGPGGPAVSSLVSQVNDSMGDRLTEHYDIVAMDPRGVGASTPIKCLTDHEQDNYNAYGVITDEDVEKLKEDIAKGVEPTPEQEIQEAQALIEEFAAGCEKHSPGLGAHIDTKSVARDFDMLREMLGQEKFNYLGYSYGTFLGATYAELFPSSVGLMVLDAAVDPALNADEISTLQMKGFDESIKHWIDDCQAGPGCPLPGDQREGIKRLKEFLKRLEGAPLATIDPERPLTQNQALTAVIGAMYNEDFYPILTAGMSQALMQDDGSILLNLADLLSNRSVDGTYSDNSGQAIIAVNSLDYVAVGTEKDWIPQAMQLRSELEIMDEYVGYDSAGLSVWPYKGVDERKPITAEGAPVIVVIGRTHDPATPYVMSQNLAGQLRSGVLVTVEGWGHGSYGKDAGDCLVDAVEDYLVDGVVPEKGLTCN